MEKNTVRSVENFSTGTRGALSAEYFLKASPGIRVIYFHRQDCKRPFLSRLNLEDLFDSAVKNGNCVLNDQLASAILEYQAHKDHFVEISFVSI